MNSPDMFTAILFAGICAFAAAIIVFALIFWFFTRGRTNQNYPGAYPYNPNQEQEQQRRYNPNYETGGSIAGGPSVEESHRGRVWNPNFRTGGSIGGGPSVEDEPPAQSFGGAPFEPRVENQVPQPPSENQPRRNAEGHIDNPNFRSGGSL